MFVLTLLLTICTIIPWRLAFDGESREWEITYYVVDGIFFVDIILTFFTTFTSKGGMVEMEDKVVIA
jgi:hypothetical protein